MKNHHTIAVNITRIINGQSTSVTDELATEEPLEIRLCWKEANQTITRNISVTMRTPGNDEELAMGFLFNESIIQGAADIHQFLIDPANPQAITVQLRDGFIPDLKKSERNFLASAACGVCGKSGIDQLGINRFYTQSRQELAINATVLYGLEQALLQQQSVFSHTGGLHAAALFDAGGKFMLVREDIGRHNALDKLIGACLVDQQIPLDNHILLLSGRAGFELVQKAAMAGLLIVAAVGAPSTLAVDTARSANITLVGFLRQQRFNIYTAPQRIIVEKIQKITSNEDSYQGK